MVVPRRSWSNAKPSRCSSHEHAAAAASLPKVRMRTVQEVDRVARAWQVAGGAQVRDALAVDIHLSAERVDVAAELQLGPDDAVIVDRRRGTAPDEVQVRTDRPAGA